MINKYNAFLFDMDGTLVNTEHLKGKALAEACIHFGGQVSPEVYKKTMGESIEVVANFFFKQSNISPDLNLFLNKFKGIYQDSLKDNITLIPGVNEFIDILSARNVKLGLVSSAYMWMVKNILSQIGLLEKFQTIITKEDVDKHKPHPQAYNLALKQLNIKTSETLIFEDSNAGLIAASRAGCDSIAVLHDYNVESDLSTSLMQINNFSVLSDMLN